MRSILILLGAIIISPSAYSQEAKPLARYTGPKDKLLIYILAGQSNMSGRAKVEEQDRQIPKNLFLLDAKGDWVQATHPVIQYTTVPNAADDRVIKAGGKSGLNFGLTFARRMLEANPDVSIGLVVNSMGGSSIQSWKKGTKTGNYDKTLSRFQPAQNSGIVKGVLWHQGEANLDLGENYLDALVPVIEQFRKDLDNPNLPFVAGQIAPLPKGKDKIQAFNQALLKLPTLVPHTRVVQADDLSGKDIHFDAVETRKLGLRYAEEMIRLQGK